MAIITFDPGFGRGLLEYFISPRTLLAQDLLCSPLGFDAGGCLFTGRNIIGEVCDCNIFSLFFLNARHKPADPVLVVVEKIGSGLPA